MKRASTAERLMELALGSCSESSRIEGSIRLSLEASRVDVLRHRLKVGNKGLLVVDPDGEGHHHNGEETKDEKRVVMRRLKDYNLTHESCSILHLRDLRREGFGSAGCPRQERRRRRLISAVFSFYF